MMRANKTRREKDEIVLRLEQLEDLLFAAVTTAGLDIVEGTVMTQGPRPYRRLDCGYRALAYVKCRPQKEAVRIDVSGLWRRPRPSPLQVTTASGGTTLMVKNAEDLKEAIAFLKETVVASRAQAA